MKYTLLLEKKVRNFRIGLCFLCILTMTCVTLYGQETAADTSGSDALIEKGVKLHDEGKYDEAIALYNQVCKCDPAYPRAAYEAALSFYESGRNAEALQKCDEAISLHFFIPPVFSLKSTLLDESGKPREGAALIDSVLKFWPYNQNLLYNLALCLINADEVEKAEKVLFKSLTINPFHPRSNLALAKVNLIMGRTGQSYLAYNMAMMLNPGNSFISEYQDALFGRLDSLIRPYRYPYKDEPNQSKWKDLAILIQSDLTGKDNFKFPYEPDLKIMRTSLLLFQSLKYDPDDPGFYNSFYVRFFTEMMKENGFDVFMNYCLHNFDYELVAKWIRKNREKLDSFISQSGNRINSWKGYGFSSQNEKAGIAWYHFNDQGTLESVGAFSEADKTRPGSWIDVDEYGSVVDSGVFMNGKKSGEWLYYWPNGTVKQRLPFLNDSLNGECITYYKNGAKQAIYHFVSGQRHGREEQFTPSGLLTSFTDYSNDSYEGPAMYLNTESWSKREYSNSNNQAEGILTEKWLNGARKRDGNYKQGLRDGIHRYWYENDTLESVEPFVNDTLQGFSRYFHPNGKISTECRYEKGKLEGVVRQYFRDGKLMEVDSGYVNDVCNGTWTTFYPSGIRRDVTRVKNDTLIGITSYDSTGRIIYETVPENGLLHYKSFYPDGRLRMEGDFLNNKRSGEWITYNPGGTIINSFSYVDGQNTGWQLTWYRNGKLKERYQTDSGNIIGPYVEYFRNGSLKSKGNYNRKGMTGEWCSYFPDGSLRNTSFASDGNYTGCMILRSNSGKPESEIHFDENGKDIRRRYFDREGNLIYDWDYQYGESTGRVPYPDGAVYQIFTVRDNLRKDTSIIYYPNGAPWQQTPWCFNEVNGVIKTWDPFGNLMDETNYIHGKMNGLSKEYTDGILSAVMTMENDKLEGTETGYYPNGQIAMVREWGDDVREGNYTSYSPDGSMMCRLLFWNDVIAGYASAGPDGNLLPIRPVTKETTEITTTYPNGKLSMKAGVKAGIYHGPFTSWYPDGTVMEEGAYLGNDEDGVYKKYYPGMVLKEYATYKDGYKNGEYRSYFPDGKIRMKGMYYYNERNGDWEVYDQTGKQTATYRFDNGNLYEIITL